MLKHFNTQKYNTAIRINSLMMIILILSCAFSKYHVQEDLFGKYYNQIGFCKLPLTFDCFADSNYTKYTNDIINDTNLINRYQPKCSKIFGRLKTNKDVVSIIYLITADFYYPTVFTFHPDGTPIDTLCLYSGASCDAYPENWTRNTSFINNDETFTLVDTTGTYKLDTITWNKIAGSDSIVVSTYKYKMNKSGYFDLISSTKSAKELY